MLIDILSILFSYVVLNTEFLVFSFFQHLLFNSSLHSVIKCFPLHTHESLLINELAH